MTQAIIDSRQLAEALAGWATAGGIAVAIFAGIFAYWRYRRDRAYHEWDRAREAFTRFNALAMDHPQFYPGCWSRMRKDDLASRNQFEWYAAAMLWACEEIYSSTNGKDAAWRGTIKILIRDHVDYFSSPEFTEDLDGYDPAIKAIIDECRTEAAAEAGTGERGSDAI